MTRHTVLQGEGISSLALQYGLLPEAIWNDPANGELRKLRGNGNILLPGDVVHIPEKVPGVAVVATGKRHVFRRLGVPARFSLQLFRNGQPRAEEAYQLEIGGAVLKGSTDAEGSLTVWVPNGARTGLLVIGPQQERIGLSFGHLDPLTEAPGIQKRLKSLGILDGEVTGKLDKATMKAIKSFQARYELPVTGKADEQTLRRLGEVYDRRGRLQGDGSP